MNTTEKAPVMEDKPKPSVGRKRGRPRTVTDDQEVPERRRKQLRLAQQAYRKRKENTIGALQNRVHELENGIESLGQSFLSFSSILLEEQLLSQYPQIAVALQDITRQCVSLAKTGSDEWVEGALVRPTIAKDAPVKTATTPDNDTRQVSIFDIPTSDTSTDVEDIIRSAAKSWPGPPTPPYQDQAVLPFGIVMPPPTDLFSYTPPLSSSSLTDETDSNTILLDHHWTIAQRLVRTCCHMGYRLLVDQPNHDRIPEIFGSALSTVERNRLISGFYAVTQDKTGAVTDVKANVLSFLRASMENFSEGQLQLSSRVRQIALESASDSWMDANGVQKYLREKRYIVDDFSGSSGRLGYSVSSSLDLPAFIKALSGDSVCVGYGPTFRRQSVEKALHTATLNVSWGFDNICDI
ncbi:hypothetical protein N7499_012026 [Penicillium canescens]|uniref:BZIP domain-containing protein n=1 Tax=Penicillium canescens TaxID=5083 RepID=A0AAD6IMQ2_PENCN|nr:uncharacterized protein N7446_007293 [Penicillium canescens]KAJ5991366.1 hypothetical protein N7522_011573 [Penicillium canescens]KAJ6049375.1 hypothetical protein N7444_006091 [Penicillium canescens]KAJ6052655.1 hypothetical protein N7460_003189 [Penicillium canescens]KAJ6063173.1 hypothetical protein N7446_007293 [Penicillium canescens]KAJ6070139.1 hypothetical protein N7499_012026 [Penicillium canescens]